MNDIHSAGAMQLVVLVQNQGIWKFQAMRIVNSTWDSFRVDDLTYLDYQAKSFETPLDVITVVSAVHKERT